MGKALVYLQKIPYKYLALFEQGIVSGGNFLMIILLSKVLSLSELGSYTKILIYAYFCNALLLAYIIHPFQKKTSDNSISIYLSLFFISLISFVAFFVAEKNTVLFVYIYLFAYSMQELARRFWLQQKQIKKAILLSAVSYSLQFFFLFINYKSLNNNSVLWIVSITSLFSILVFFVPYLNYHFSFKSIVNSAINNFQLSTSILLIALLQWFSGNFVLLKTAAVFGADFLGVFKIYQNYFGLINLFFLTIENNLPATISTTNIKWLYQNFTSKFKNYTSYIFFLLFLVSAGSLVYAFYFSIDLKVDVCIVFTLFCSQLIGYFGIAPRLILRLSGNENSLLLGYVISVLLSFLLANFFIVSIVSVLVILLVSQLLPVLIYYFIVTKKVKNNII